MKEIIPVASDHAGYELKEKVKNYLCEKGFEVRDFGTYSTESVDYPDYVHQVGSAVEKAIYRRGIVICGSGNGAQMTVNKYPHVRCALCWTPELALLGRAHNDANILSLPARFISDDDALQIVDKFLNTAFEGGRHARRVEKISRLSM
ncbi:MAG: ribose 5-phosphate isomerase B [bacterium P3]|nr:MAG: ribose 5-phosphate isomerase B [bacterium P3]KWW41077.1 MAG: ribose 5-phosphate isomerase B [bacterium F083]